MRFARRMDKLGVVASFEVLQKAKQMEAEGRDIIHLEIGEPDFKTADHIKEAGIQAIRDNYTHYSAASGFWDLREAIAEYESKFKGFEVSPEEVVVTSGGKPIMYYAITLFSQRGDEILSPNPGYPVYESIIRFCGGKPIPFPFLGINAFNFDPGLFKSLVTPRTKMIILNTPSNPTGTIFTQKDLEFIAKIAIRNDLMVLSDEIYSRIVYEGEFNSIAAIPGMKERTIVLDGLSKSHAMTGWRLGWGIMPKKISNMMNRLNGNITSCASTITQRAAIQAITGDQTMTHEMVKKFRERRNLMVKGLNKIPGFTTLKPFGAFYVFPNIEGTGMQSQVLANFLLDNAGVALLPGTGFGKYGEGYLRLSYANSSDNIRAAVKKIEDALLNGRK